MKPGSGDDPFADDEDEGVGESENAVEPVEQNETGADVTSGDNSSEGRLEAKSTYSEDSEVDKERQTTNSLPYIYRRDRVQDGRSGVTFYLRDQIREEENEFVEELEELLGEDVYVADAREAALDAAFRNPEIVAEVLREWGYDFDD